jgi:hypothetical protein
LHNRQTNINININNLEYEEEKKDPRESSHVAQPSQKRRVYEVKQQIRNQIIELSKVNIQPIDSVIVHSTKPT